MGKGFTKRVCLPKVLSMNGLAECPKYKSNQLRVQHRKELLHILSERYVNVKSKLNLWVMCTIHLCTLFQSVNVWG